MTTWSKLVVSAGLPIARCSSPAARTAAATPGRRTAGTARVMSTPSNGTPIVFLVPVAAERGRAPEALTSTGEAACDGCRAEAVRYFRTGAMASNCAICNAGLTAADASPPPVRGGRSGK